MPYMTPDNPQSFPQRPRRRADSPEDSISRIISSWRTSRPDLRVEPIAITARLDRLYHTLGAKLESAFERFGIRGADFAVIATLVRLGDAHVSQRRIGSELRLSPGTISLRVDRLARRGLVTRNVDPQDGRGALLSPTDAGRDLFEACAPEHLANAQGLLEGLSEHEREQLGRLLGKLLDTLEEPAPADRLEPELGVVVEAAPVALERRRAVGLPQIPGLLVSHVHPTGPAAASGIRAGDLLRSANRRPLRSRHDLRLALNETHGRAFTVEALRGNKPLRLQIDPHLATAKRALR
ncbi:MAG: MarR family transcriptional regulator [Solirubrobacterales bacterium]|nr:MarR family transcriptional regulator [Solirubrobacterales bacterium]